MQEKKAKEEALKAGLEGAKRHLDSLLEKIK